MSWKWRICKSLCWKGRLATLTLERVNVWVRYVVRMCVCGHGDLLSVSSHRVSHQALWEVQYPSSSPSSLSLCEPLFSWLQRACVSPHAACWPLTLYTSLSRLSVSFYMFYAQWMTPISWALHWCVSERERALPYFDYHICTHNTEQSVSVGNQRLQQSSVRFFMWLLWLRT